MRRALAAFAYPLRGLRSAWGDARLRALAWPPAVFFCGALVGTAVACVKGFGALSALVWARPAGAWLVLWYPLQVFLALALAVAALFAVLVVQAIFTAPWNDALSERVERLRTGQGGPPSSVRQLLGDVGRTIQIELGKLALYVGVMLPLFVLSSLVPVVGPVVFAFVGWISTALFFAFDYMDWPMSRRGWGFRRRIAFLRGDLASAMGFGTGCWLLLFLPVVNVFFVAGAVTGGTNLFLDLSEAKR